jgi:hypothetical protein
MPADGKPGADDWAAPGSSIPPPGWSTEQPPPSNAPAWGEPAGPPVPVAATPDASGWGTPYAPPPPPRPGIVPLRPLGVGELLDGAFTAIRRYPRATLGLSAAVMLLVSVVTLLVEWALLVGVRPPAEDATWDESKGYVGRAVSSAFVEYGVSSLGTLLLSGMITVVIGQAVLGRSMSAADAWVRLRPLVWRLVGVAAMTYLILLGIAAVTLVPGLLVLVLGPEVPGVLLLLAGAAAWLVLSIYAYTALALAPAALVLEKQTVRRALSRSRALVKGSWWRVLGILLLALVIGTVLSGIISLPFGLAGSGFSAFGESSDTLRFTDLLLATIGSLVAGTLVQPFSAGVAALLYIDRRIRAEALDVTLTRAAAEPVPE